MANLTVNEYQDVLLKYFEVEEELEKLAEDYFKVWKAANMPKSNFSMDGVTFERDDKGEICCVIRYSGTCRGSYDSDSLTETLYDMLNMQPLELLAQHQAEVQAYRALMEERRKAEQEAQERAQYEKLHAKYSTD